MICEAYCHPRWVGDVNAGKCKNNAKWIIPANKYRNIPPKYVCGKHKNEYERKRMSKYDLPAIQIKSSISRNNLRR